MGKFPTSRRGPRGVRSSPLAAGSVTAENGDESDRDGPLDSHELLELKRDIMKNLLSQKPAERECGAILFANLLQTNKDAVNHWFERVEGESMNGSAMKTSHIGDITRTLAPLLLDEKPSVRTAAADALSRLSSASELFAEMMVELDVMTPLRGCFEKYFDNTEWVENSKKYDKEIFAFACDITSNLCARSPKALKVFNESNLSVILAKNMGNFEKCSKSAAAAAEALVTVSEDNVLVDLRQKEFIAILVKLLALEPVDGTNLATNSSSLLLTSYAGLLLTSLTDALNETETLSALKLTLKNVSTTLKFQCTENLMTFAENISKLGGDLKNDEAEEVLRASTTDLVNVLSAKRVCLETLANMCSENDWEEEDGNEMDVDGGEESDSDSVSEGGCHGVQETKGFDNPEVESVITELNLLELVVNHLDSPNDLLKKELLKVSYGREVLNEIASVQKNALLCVNNLVQSLPKDELRDTSGITQRLLALVQSEVGEKVHVLLPEAMSVTRAMVDTGALNIPATDVPMFFQLVNSSTDDLLSINAIKVLGSVASSSTDMNQVEAIASFLLQFLESAVRADTVTSVTLDVKAEALDNIIDVFSEDGKTDDVVVKINLLSRLREVGKSFKLDMKESKRRTKRKHPVADTVSLNVNRFIKYKQSMVGKR